MIRDCAQFEAWLDGGCDPAHESAAMAHAAGCARCAGALELEALLAAPPVTPAAPGFTAQVLARVREVDAARAGARLGRDDYAFSWWLQLPAEPATALAFVVAALFAWRADALWTLALTAAARTAAFAASFAAQAGAIAWSHAPGADAVARALAAVPDGPGGTLAVCMALLPVVGGLSWLLYRALERLVLDFAARPAAG